jgi:hypothetical protein
MDAISGSNAAALDRLVTRLLAAWNAPDRIARDRQLRMVWSDEGRFSDPLVSLTGREALSAFIEEWRTSQPGLRLVVTGEIAMHHGQLHITWAVLDGCGREMLAGSSVGEFDLQCGFLSLVSFYSPAADQSSSATASSSSTQPRT